MIDSYSNVTGWGQYPAYMRAACQLASLNDAHGRDPCRALNVHGPHGGVPKIRGTLVVVPIIKVRVFGLY